MSSVMERLPKRMAELTASERIIADWLQDNIDSVAFKPAAYIAEQCGVSEATVVRFARKLQYASYQELQEAVQQSVQEQLTFRHRLERTITHIPADDMVSSVFATEIQNLQHSLSRIDRAAFETAVERLATARKVGVLGLRASYASASYLSYNLNLVRPEVISIADVKYGPSGSLIDYSADDVMVLISVARADPRALAVAQFCSDRGIPTIGLTDWKYAPLSPYCDPCFKLEVSGVLWQSYLGINALCSALILGVAHRLDDTAKQRLNDLDKLYNHRSN